MQNKKFLGVGWWKVGGRGIVWECLWGGVNFFKKPNLFKWVRTIFHKPYFTKIIFAHIIFWLIVIRTIFSQYIFNPFKLDSIQPFGTPNFVYSKSTSSKMYIINITIFWSIYIIVMSFIVDILSLLLVFLFQLKFVIFSINLMFHYLDIL